jgi:trimeric autotransporter adhesin
MHHLSIQCQSPVQRLARIFRWATATGAAALLVACGGGGGGPILSSEGGGGGGAGGGVAPAAPPVLVINGYGIKSFDFLWDPVADAAQYQLIEDPDGDGPLEPAQVAAVSDTAYTHEVPLYMRLNARYTVRACNASGACSADSPSVQPFLNAAIGYLKASNTGSGNLFGAAIAISRDGSTLAVGARQEGDVALGQVSSGAVYVSRRSAAGQWSAPQIIKAQNVAFANMSAQFGFSLALSADGSTLAIGAPGDDSDSDQIDAGANLTNAQDAGAVHVWVRTGEAWSHQAYIKAFNSDFDDNFGFAVALSDDGHTLAVGAPNESSADAGGGDGADNDLAASGAVYMYRRSGLAWSQTAYVKASAPAEEDRFGQAVALSADGRVLAVGAPLRDIFGTSDAGAAYVFAQSDAGVWAEQQILSSNSPQAGRRLGSTIALSGDGRTLALSSFNGSSGPVLVFYRAAVVWALQASLSPPPAQTNDFIGGLALSSDGSTLAVGATQSDGTGLGLNSDAAQLAGQTAGGVYVFRRSAALAWTQPPTYLKAPNAGSGDNFGWAVALSGDAKTLAVGADGEDSNTTGWGGNAANNSAISAGAAYLY